MINNLSLGIIKPDAFEKKCYGKIIDKILINSFEILNMKIDYLDKKTAEEFYFIHKNKSFFSKLIKFMISAPIIPIIIKKDDAVNSFRELIGSTNPNEANKGTIRKEFAKSIQRNAIHGSDSNENAIKEIVFFFPSFQI